MTAPDGVSAIGPQQVGSNHPFSIKITAKDAQGNVKPYSGSLVLSGPSPVGPSTTYMNFGVANVDNVYITRAGYGLTITASTPTSSMTGTSQPFNVLTAGGIVGAGCFEGTVTDNRDVPLPNVKVRFDANNDNIAEYETTTRSDGTYKISLPAASYVIWADNGILCSSSQPETIDPGAFRTVDFKLPVYVYNGKTPVILIPGIMGSTAKSHQDELLPILPPDDKNKTSPNKLVIWDAYNPDPRGGPLKWIVGISDLVDALEDKGYRKEVTLFGAPYDWRRPVNEIVEKYLKPVIQKAKDACNNCKVNIIAHSTGGLVVRHYIQSDDYANDIYKFAMVGTPNLGAVNAYYMWEGGDPLWADKLNGNTNFLLNPDGVYWAITKNLYERTYKELGKINSDDHRKIKQFYQEKVPEIEALLPTFPFLKPTSGSSYAISQNDTLHNLNANDTFGNRRKTRMSPYGGDGTVITKLFYGKSGESTITEHAIAPTPASTIYDDGTPSRYAKPVKGAGDETVPLASAKYPSSSGEGWADDYASTSSASHMSLIKEFKTQLANFVDQGEPQVAKSAAKLLNLSVATTIAPERHLVISYYGSVVPYLVAPDGSTSGVNSTTQEVTRAISGSTLTMEPEGGSLALVNPVDGAYTLAFSGVYEEEYTVTIAFTDSSGRKTVEYQTFHHVGGESGVVTINSASPEKLTITHAPQPPIKLQADAVGTTNLTTKLSWQATGETGVTKYAVYSRRLDEPNYTRQGEATGTTFDTSHPWAKDATVMTRYYAVTALKSDGSESFFSAQVGNDDRDHDGLTDEEEITFGTDPAKVDTDGDGYSDALEIQRGSNPLDKNSVPKVPLTVIPSGTGGGSVNSDPTGIACTSQPVAGICLYDFPLNATVSLSALLNGDSLFGSWSGACTGVGACAPVMSEPRDVTATFDFVKPAKVGATLYDTLTAAYGDSAAGTILAREYTLIGDFTLDAAKSVTLSGGYDASYITRPGATTINGKLTVGKGSLTVDRVVIK